LILQLMQAMVLHDSVLLFIVISYASFPLLQFTTALNL